MEPVWQPRPKFQDRVWLHLLLFVLTIATTTYVGVFQYLSYVSDFEPLRELPAMDAALLVRGLWYSVTILAILGCHELGHYVACRYYDVDASLPFFLPVPISITGTLGAFIRIREPIPQKRMLFDIGIAGPLAGFAVAVPALFIGVAMSHVVAVPENFSGVELGEPLLFKIAEWMLWGPIKDPYSLNLHPIAFAAWFGLLATALNLFPIGQLDGGHICYAVLGPKSTYVTIASIGIAITLAAYFSASWIVWSGLMVVMLIVFGPRHPRVFDEHIPLDRTRIILAMVALVIFVLCFTPAPISELIKR
ncbi:MAG TPA: site-2 protease family protein [Vicinamibacterales bacterium]|nr:site-2 protease family protein [Vicinamibacterales bacterium]